MLRRHVLIAIGTQALELVRDRFAGPFPSASEIYVWLSRG